MLYALTVDFEKTFFQGIMDASAIVLAAFVFFGLLGSFIWLVRKVIA